MVTWFTSDSAVSFFFFIQSATSSDFFPLSPRAATASWLSKQIMVYSFTNLFLRKPVTQAAIAPTPAWKAVASCPSKMCHCILLWCLQIPAPVPYWLQAPSVNQTSSFLSWLGQFFHHSSLVGITIRYLPKVRRRVTWSFIILNLLSTLSAFAQIDYVLFQISRIWLRRTYAYTSFADSTIIPTVGRSKSISNTCWSCSHRPCDQNACCPLPVWTLPRQSPLCPTMWQPLTWS